MERKDGSKKLVTLRGNLMRLLTRSSNTLQEKSLGFGQQAELSKDGVDLQVYG